MSAAAASSVYLIKGDDAALVAQEVRGLLDKVVGDGDHALIVEEIGGGAGDELSVGHHRGGMPLSWLSVVFMVSLSLAKLVCQPRICRSGTSSPRTRTGRISRS